MRGGLFKGVIIMSMMNRGSYFANLKGALILMVVIGHFLMPMELTRLVWCICYLIFGTFLCHQAVPGHSISTGMIRILKDDAKLLQGLGECSGRSRRVALKESLSIEGHMVG